MKTLTTATLNQIIEEKNTALISGTNIQGETIIDGKTLNFPIANALRAISLGNIKFSKAEVYLEDVMEDESGYLFKKNDKSIFLIWNAGKKRISEVILNEEATTYSEEEFLTSLLQSVLLLEMELNLTNENTLEQISAWKEVEIKLGSSEATLFSNLVDKLENAIRTNVLEVSDITESEFEVNSEKLLLEDILSEKTITVPSTSEIVEVKMDVPDSLNETNFDDNEEINGVALKQISLFGDEELETVTPSPKKEKQRAPKQKSSKQEIVEKVKKIEKIVPVVTLDDVKSYSDLIFDDTKAEEKLVSLGFDTRTIKAAIEFRKIQREKVLKPDQMLLIPNKMTYVGWSEPVEDTVVALLTKNHILIKAEAGTGKSTMVRTVCALLNYPLFFIGGSVDADIETFLGFKTLEDGNVEFVDGPVVKAVKTGGLIYLDEGNSVMESVLIKLHSVLDDQGEIFVEASGEVYKVHPNTRFVTTINEGYAGTREFNDATADRMVGIEMDYMSSDHLWGLLENFDGGFTEYQKDILKMGRISRGDLIILTEVAKALQFAAKEGVIEAKVASTRNIIALMKTTRLYSFKKAIRFVLKKYSKDEQPAIASVLETVEDLDLKASDMLSL